jgi:HSP20 family protein
MAIVRWQPFQELVSLREAMDRLFEDSFVRPSLPAAFFGDSLGMAVDMYQDDKDVVVKASLPGVKPEEVDISITGDVLTIKGEHKEEEEVKEKDYFRKELRYGTFSRSLQLPVAVNSDKAEAVFENGLLTLTLPKAEEARPKQIKVKTRKLIEGKKEEKK